MTRKGILAFLSYKFCFFVMVLAGIATFCHIWPVSFEHFCNLMHEWDAKHILRVASEGYLAQAPSIQVYPMTPLVIRLFYFLMFPFGSNWNIASVLAAQFCSALAFYYFFKAAKLEYGDKKAWLATILFACFPTAYFLGLPYSESAFCAASFAFVYFYKKGNAKGAFIAGLCATLSRVMGVFLLAAVVGEHVLLWKKKTAAERRKAIWACLGLGLGIFGYLYLNYHLYGEWFYYLQEQKKHWSMQITWPFSGAIAAINGFEGRTPGDRFFVVGLELAAAVLGWAIVPSLIKQRRWFDAIYYICTLMLLCSTSFWVGKLRYLLPLYPIYTVLAEKIGESQLRLAAYLFISCAMFGLFLAIYMNAQWTF